MQTKEFDELRVKIVKQVEWETKHPFYVFFFGSSYELLLKLDSHLADQRFGKI